jgi:hypothetical protein
MLLRRSKVFRLNQMIRQFNKILKTNRARKPKLQFRLLQQRKAANKLSNNQLNSRPKLSSHWRTNSKAL